MAGLVFRIARLKPLLFPLMAALLLHLCTFFPEKIEQVYGVHVYPFWAYMIGNLMGLFPFSVGDLLYVTSMLWFVRWIYLWKKHSEIWITALSTVTWIYVIFQLGWGLNYSRPPVDKRLGLVSTPSDAVYLPALTAQLLARTNTYATSRVNDKMPDFDSLVQLGLDGYAIVSKSAAIPTPTSKAVKRSLFGRIGNYMGYSGYFNPFTGEAQLNDAVPSVLHPFVIAHEIGHQLGFAREQDANLAGFLASRASADSIMRYAAYFDMFLYANAALFLTDSLTARKHLIELHPHAKRDLESLRAFRKQYRTPVEDFIDYVYDHYLKANGQTEGTRSYSIVVLTLLAMYRAEGRI